MPSLNDLPALFSQGGYWEAKETGSFGRLNLTDIYNVSPVVSKDMEAAKVYQRALPPEYTGAGAGVETV